MMTQEGLPQAAHGPENSAATVFVVDDDPGFRKSIRWMIESTGLNVETFSSAPEFLAGYRADIPGCLLLDVRMPGMGGLELQEHLKQRGVEIPIIIVTGHADVPTAVRSMKSGAVDFVEKPFSDELLLNQIDRAISNDIARRRSARRTSEIEAKRDRLTPREREVMELVVDGMSSREIAEQLGVSFKTVAAHRSKIMSKMEAKSLPHLIQMNLGGESPEKS